MTSKAALRTQADVFKLPQPAQGEAVYFDAGKPSDRAPGLALRVRAAGSRNFVFFYRRQGKPTKYAIGDAKAWTLDAARAEARTLRVTVDRGEDPAAVRDAKAAAVASAALTFAAVKRQYLNAAKITPTSRKKIMRESTHREYSRYLNSHCKPLDALPVASIKRADIAARIKAITTNSGAFAADRARAALSAMFAWAIGEGLCDANPVDGTNKQSDSTPRDRMLTDAELVAIWKAAPDNDYGRIVKLLMLTGQRRDEVGSMRWSELDDAAALWTLPGTRTKNGRPHGVPLSAAALDILRGAVVRDERPCVFGRGMGGFSGWSKSKAALDEAAPLAPWRIHDLRRTMATRMADLGVLPHVIESTLNHISGHKAGVAGIYNLSTYAAEKRAALDLWASHVLVLVAQAEGTNVVLLRGVNHPSPIH